MQHVEPNNILYFGFLHVWEKLGSSDELLRLPSVMAFPAAVLLTAAIAWRGFGRTAGVAAGLLLALNALALRHAQEARAYGLLMALVAASMLCFVLVVERPTTRRWALWVAVSALAAYMQPFALLVVAAQALSLAWLPPGRVRWRAAAIAAAALALAVLPLLVLLTSGNTSRLSWIQEPNAGFAWNVLQQLAGAPGQPLLFLLYMGLALVLLAGALVARPRRSEKAWRAVLPVLWFVVPVVLTGAISVVQPMFLPKYLIVSVPALAVLAAGGLARLRPLPLAAAAVLVLCALHVTGLSDWYGSRQQDWRAAAALIRPRAPAYETILTDPVGSATLAWYLGRTSGLGTPGSVRRAQAVSPGQERAELRAMPRLWLVQARSENGFEDRVPRRALGERRVLGEWHVYGLRVRLLGRPLSNGSPG